MHVQKTRCMYRKQGECTENKMHVQKQDTCTENKIHVQKTRCMYRNQGVCTEKKINLAKFDYEIYIYIYQNIYISVKLIKFNF